MNNKRLDSETKQMYHKRLQREQREVDERLRGKVIWPAYSGNPATKAELEKASMLVRELEKTK